MVLDLIIIGLIIFSTIIGYKKGVMEVAFNLLSFVISLILSIILYIPVTNYVIDNTPIYNNVKEIIQDNLNKQEITQNDDGKIIINENIPEVVTDYINNLVNDVAQTAKDNISEVIASSISLVIIKIICLIGIFIVIRIILDILKAVTNVIAKLPIINSANKIRGNNIWIFKRINNNLCITCNSNGNFSNNNK